MFYNLQKKGKSFIIFEFIILIFILKGRMVVKYKEIHVNSIDLWPFPSSSLGHSSELELDWRHV